MSCCRSKNLQQPISKTGVSPDTSYASRGVGTRILGFDTHGSAYNQAFLALPANQYHTFRKHHAERYP